MALIICPECKKEISDKSNVCVNCGFPLWKHTNKEMMQKTTCPNCSIQNDAMAYYCISCGYKFRVNDRINPISSNNCINNKFPILTILSFVTIILFVLIFILFRIGWIINSVLLISSFVFSILALKSDEKIALMASIPLVVSVILALSFILIEIIN